MCRHGNLRTPRRPTYILYNVTQNKYNSIFIRTRFDIVPRGIVNYYNLYIICEYTVKLLLNSSDRMFRRSKRVSGRIHNILGVCADKSFRKGPPLPHRAPSRQNCHPISLSLSRSSFFLCLSLSLFLSPFPTAVQTCTHTIPCAHPP